MRDDARTAYPLSDGSRGRGDQASNDEMLRRLDEAKRRHPEETRRADLLRDPEIRDLAFELLAANEAWINAQVKANCRGRDFDDMKSRALAGAGGENADVGGVLGAILEYDYRRADESGQEVQARAFTPYLARAVHRALTPRGKELREIELARSAVDRNDKAREWRDRHQREAREIAIDHELLQELDDTIEVLPERNRRAARFIVDMILETGERPTDAELGAAQVPPVTKQMGNILGKQSVARLVETLEERNPQLAEDGIGGWDELKAAFGIHKHAKAAVTV